jgi:succinate-semialdehyde dehydrogenase / glutarate-semialdehyde dehydrogenase
VFDDVNLDIAVQGIVSAKLRNSGQVCISPNRVYAQSGIYDQFVEKLRDAVAKIRTEQSMQDDFVVGPLINQSGLNKVTALVADATDKGARVVLGGKLAPQGGLFYLPTILADVTDEMQVASTEIFGPVFTIYRFESEDEVVTRANDSEFGLVAYAYTREVGRAFRLSRNIEAGMVILNSGLVGTASVPFGGIKQSGYGREGSYYGIEEYVHVKYVLMAGLDI